MKSIVILLVHLLTTVAKLLAPVGRKVVLAENLLLNQQRYRQVNRGSDALGIMSG